LIAVDRREHLAEAYARHHVAGGRYGFVMGGDERAKILAALVGIGHRVLDIGCRDGALTRYYLTGNRVAGIDIDRTALDRCRELGIETGWGDVSNGLPYDDSEFDVVVAAEIIEHIAAPAALVAEIARVLKRGGLFVGSVPNAFRLKNRLLFLCGQPFESDPTHLHQFSPQQVRAMLATRFCDVRLQFASSRLLAVWPRMFGNCLIWQARRA
jgi:SAM-dependent methyltransferase